MIGNSEIQVCYMYRELLQSGPVEQKGSWH